MLSDTRRLARRPLALLLHDTALVALWRRVPHFERLVVRARDDGLAIGREGHREHAAAVRALLLRLELQGCCRKRGGAQVWARRGIGWAGVPASHTLSVLSAEPETMVLPSGEKATEYTWWLCAFCFSALSSREAAASVGALRFSLGEGSGGLGYLHPTL